MKKKLKAAGILLLQSAAIWLIGWAYCVGTNSLMVLLNLG